MKSILSDLVKACEVTPFWLFGSCPTVLSVADAAGKNHRLIMANKAKLSGSSRA
ncbi:hypothetical protein [Variovorax sp. LG9.2]|uniref:hypothetical protein n=1 Tax=Variovorax sp. LG9.2 TaxID=3048626 RepID=UPI002B226888|nr:hypothetical protein [Variovorax sp. LG9.2]MEB0056480.1 hypothetical protein [Variovorax sp. LG9.2]